MTSSFEKINYYLRPNKCVERKMMCEALGKLAFIDNLKKYRYIGLGSPYFVDFILFHKTLGITNLVSIEKEENKRNRFEFNIPFSGIEMHYGLSHTILPNLQLEKKKNIVWLDYDGMIEENMLSDIETIVTSTPTGSIFCLSINVEAEQFSLTSEEENTKSLQEKRLSSLLTRISKNRMPEEFLNVVLNTNNIAALTYEIVNRHIISSLKTRNGDKKVKISYKQIFNFKYKDNATILTIGGILYDESQVAHVKKMQFEDLSFFRPEEESYKIHCPNLTYREVKALDKLLPNTLEENGGQFINEKLQALPLIHADIKDYAKIYRYFPNYTEAII